MRDGLGFDHQAYCDATRGEVGHFASIVRDADLGTPVPTCPGWDIADLVDHIGSIHRWAGYMVRNLSPARASFSDIDFAKPADRDRLPEWLAAGGPDLYEDLAAADPDAPMWAWGADQHARFWARRMLHETTIHRVDAELALGLDPAVESAVAVDGIEEFLENLASAARFSPSVKELVGEGEVVALTETDSGSAWRIRLLPGGFDWERSTEAGVAAASVTAPSTPLLLVLYGRFPRSAPGVVLAGDTDLLDRWFANARI